MDIGKRPTRGDKVEPDLAAAWPCTRWGLPCRRHHCRRGALLPHHFTLTVAASSRQAGMSAPGPNGPAWGRFAQRRRCIFCGTFPIRRRLPEAGAGRWALPTTVAQWCSDFPLPAARTGSGLPRYQPRGIIHEIDRRGLRKKQLPCSPKRTGRASQPFFPPYHAHHGRRGCRKGHDKPERKRTVLSYRHNDVHGEYADHQRGQHEGDHDDVERLHQDV